MPQQIPLSAPLARRLAEAADGLRDDKIYYFVSKEKYPFELIPVTGNTDTEASNAASDKAAELNAGKSDNLFYVYGPYKTEKDFEPPLQYDKIEIRFLQGDTLKHSQTLETDIGGIDTIILSLSAFDKFLLPYYARLYGPDVAQEMRTRAKNVLSADPLSGDMLYGSPKMMVIRRDHTLALGI